MQASVSWPPGAASFWMFVVNAALCDGINELLAKKQRPRTAPTLLSVLGPLMFLALRPVVDLVHGPAVLAALAAFSVVWSLYMLRVELAFAQAKRKARP